MGLCNLYSPKAKVQIDSKETISAHFNSIMMALKILQGPKLYFMRTKFDGEMSP